MSNKPFISVDLPGNNPPGCDFCDKEIRAVREYPCDDFTIGAAVGEDAPTQVWNSVGSWFACETCARLVDAGNKDALAHRAVGLITKKQLGLDILDIPTHV